MKKHIFLLLFLLLVSMLAVGCTGINGTKINSQSQENSSQSTLEYAYNDVQWGLNVQKNERILKSDFDNISIAKNKSDYNALAVAAQYEVDHTQTAIEENDHYHVSPKLQEPQNEWRAALLDYNSAGKFLLEGTTEANSGKNGLESFQKAVARSDSGTAHLKKASEALGINVPIS